MEKTFLLFLMVALFVKCHFLPVGPGNNGMPVNDFCLMNQCKNGGICKSTEFSFYCECSNGFTGSFCEFMMDDKCKIENYCENEGTCHSSQMLLPNSIVAYQVNCMCKEDYFGDRCQNKHPCLENICQNNGKCTKSWILGEYTCQCTKGFEGKHCDLPTPNLCDSNPCANNGKCYQVKNKSTSMSEVFCECIGKFKGLTCSEEITNGCLNNPCSNNGTCVSYGELGMYYCICPKTHLGKHCQIENPCNVKSCNGKGQCNIQEFITNGIRTFVGKCECLAQFGGNECELENPCYKTDVCKNGGICEVERHMNHVNGGIGFVTFGLTSCRCPKLYGGKFCEILSPCITNNPCQNEGYCNVERSHIWENSGSVDDFTKPTCDCKLGYSGEYCEMN
ncbi:DgyrCDS14624 [Dimorphilus gyrociliatus]|uniref:DgyrCDS14624 n=1 Tax=Dimorphilus gyrociliatus TaxID=2664684 RepID=A0A7I8WEI2_9ANNE|nr:DgyrCDS14624 [Dimorphilus gyrociliatus]